MNYDITGHDIFAVLADNKHRPIRVQTAYLLSSPWANDNRQKESFYLYAKKRLAWSN
jgi:hypothetical protein